MKKSTYQWPDPFDYSPVHNNSIGYSKNQLYKEIENFFIKKFNIDAILVPSVRAGIAMLIRYFGINRSHTSFVTKWSSHCMFNTIGAFTNITTKLDEDANFVVINHKWGKVVNVKTKQDNTIYVEDSVDSIHLNKNAFFPNDTDFELISLPKIIGSYSGGVIFSNNNSFSKVARSLQKENTLLAEHQSYCKTMPDSKVNNYDTWLYHESWNTAHDVSSLIDIKKKLNNYDKNKKIILERLHSLNKINSSIGVPSNRLGPVLILSKKLAGKCKIMSSEVLHFSWNKYLENQEYEKVLIVPIHMGISDNEFKKIISFIEKEKF